MNPVIKIDGLSFGYEFGDSVLKDIYLEISPGEMVALVGQNGAGKTTLVKHLIGLLRPPAGKVRVADLDVANTRVSKLSRQVGYVFQNPDHQIFHDTVQAEVAFGLNNLGLPREEVEPRVTAALSDVGLEHLANENPQRLSRGQRQRVALASVLALRTPVIVLDEPTTGQDYQERKQIMALVEQLNKAGHTIVFITHDMSLVAHYASRVVVLCQGQIILDGDTREVFRQTDKLAESLLLPPQVTVLANQLNEPLNTSVSPVILSVDEMQEYLQRVREVKRNGAGD
ncbi:energy-coupling factor ABC transporter ATP-binding protein [Desulforamulus aeronauticus]|uniref:Energy-coupling factor transport system ATP-binding protein n=1 Tax=Desulforamulus aeronauticus DSM 10349 TaxID=1121421 RepID=A0A1M6SP00_9FIRM|nr:ABC transporter ATP-binding protein [Desulforamulus aeronauticus]SHK46349.1 energy-coupling factor transport system ATP-binding protein [Desulforamulus aeronauticus DSM 10349]